MAGMLSTLRSRHRTSMDLSSDRWHEKLTSNDHRWHSQFQDEVRKHDTEAKYLRDQMQTETENFNSRNQLAKLEKEEYIKEIASLRSQMISTRDKLNSAQDQLQNAEISLEQLRSEKERFSGDLRAKTQELEESETCKTSLEASVRYLTKSNNDLTGQLERANQQLEELKQELEKLKQELETAIKDLDNAVQAREQLEMDSKQQLSEMQKVCDQMVSDKQTMVLHWQKEFEVQRSLHAEREQQLMEDCEWKIREVQKDSKTRLETEGKKSEESLRLATQELEAKFNCLLNTVSGEKDCLQEELRQTRHELRDRTRSAEAELRQMRGVTSELEKGIKVATTTVNQMVASEEKLREDLIEAKTQLRDARINITKLQGEITHKQYTFDRKLQEKDQKHKQEMEENIRAVEQKWEQKLREQARDMREALQHEYLQDKLSAMTEIRQILEDDMAAASVKYEAKIGELQLQICDIQQKSKDKENEIQQEMNSCKSELQHQLTALNREFRNVSDENEYKVRVLMQTRQQLKDSQLQIAALRNTMDLVKEESERRKVEEIRKLKDEYQLEIDDLRGEWEQRLMSALESQNAAHKAQLHAARKEVDKAIQMTQPVSGKKQQFGYDGEQQQRQRNNKGNEESNSGDTTLPAETDPNEAPGTEQAITVRLEDNEDSSSGETGMATACDRLPIRMTEPRPGDLIAIRQLREVLLEKHHLIQLLQEEKRALQQQLIARCGSRGCSSTVPGLCRHRSLSLKRKESFHSCGDRPRFMGLRSAIHQDLSGVENSVVIRSHSETTLPIFHTKEDSPIRSLPWSFKRRRQGLPGDRGRWSKEHRGSVTDESIAEENPLPCVQSPPSVTLSCPEPCSVPYHDPQPEANPGQTLLVPESQVPQEGTEVTMEIIEKPAADVSEGSTDSEECVMEVTVVLNKRSKSPSVSRDSNASKRNSQDDNGDFSYDTNSLPSLFIDEDDSGAGPQKEEEMSPEADPPAPQPEPIESASPVLLRQKNIFVIEDRKESTIYISLPPENAITIEASVPKLQMPSTICGPASGFPTGNPADNRLSVGVPPPRVMRLSAMSIPFADEGSDCECAEDS